MATAFDFGPVSIPGAAHPTRARRDTLDSVDVQKIPHRVIANADGNLFILAQNLRPDGNYDRIFYLVHSQVLCNTSPIFNKLFGRGSRFTERDLKTRNSSSPPNYVISGDPTAIGIALRILHHDNDCVPRSLGYRTLVELASLAERYEIRPALQLWMEMWAKEIDINEMLKPGYEEWIHVCWMFHLNGLQQISARLVKRARIHKDGSLCFTRSLFYNKFSGEFPPVVTERIIAFRNLYVTKIRRTFEALFAEYSNATVDENLCLVGNTNSVSCATLQGRHFLKCRDDHELNKAEFWKSSIIEIQEKFNNLSIVSLEDKESYAIGQDHAECSWLSYMRLGVARLCNGLDELVIFSKPLDVELVLDNKMAEEEVFTLEMPEIPKKTPRSSVAGVLTS